MPDNAKSLSQINVSLQDKQLLITIAGNWQTEIVLPDTDFLLAKIAADDLDSLAFNTQALEQWDSLLMVTLIKLINAAEQRGLQVDKSALPGAVQELLRLVYAIPERSDARRKPVVNSWSEQLSAAIIGSMAHAREVLVFVGEMVISCAAVISGQANFRRQDLWLYIQECGPSALPIVTLISLLVGLILAFVGALQLSLFGAQVYIANLVGLGMTREMGGLMTAIIMCGRTGAAYAAQLGTMHVNNEIDALKTMNLQPMAFLVLPRMLALIFIMPLLCLYADLMGIVGGGMVSVQVFNISLTEYVHNAAHAVQMKDFLVGFVKCSVFGVLIALSGCMRGMQCGASASAVGDAATSAVVTGIVFIVIADSIMTVIFNRFGI